MKKGIIALSFLLVYKTNFSQISDTALLSVTYEFKHMRDTTQRSNFYQEDMQIIIGRKIALFKSQQYEQNREKLKQAMMSGDGSNVNLGNIGYKPSNPDEIYILPSENRIFTIKNFKGSKYNIVDSLPLIKWEITNQTKNIKAFLCQKAIGKYHGRIYEVWFTTDLPYSYGPWRLNGLPGLILEASDVKGEVFFLCKDVKQNFNSKIKISNKIAKTTPKEYNRMVDAYFNDPSSMESMQAVKLTTKNAGNSNPLNKVNNPLELSKD